MYGMATISAAPKGPAALPWEAAGRIGQRPAGISPGFQEVMWLPWIAVDSKLPSHRKLRVLRKGLGIGLHEAIGVLVTIWLWALEDATHDGRITDANSKDLAESIRWRGDPDLLLTTLKNAGLVHTDAQGILIHDWPEHQGPWEAYKQRKKRQREYIKRKRNKTRTDSQGPSIDCLPDCRIDNDAIPNHTLHESHSYIDSVPQRIQDAIFEWLGGLPPVVSDDLTYFITDKGCDEDLIIEAVAETRRRGVRSWDYARAVVQSAIEEGIYTGEDFKNRRRTKKNAKEVNDGKRKGTYVEGGYDWDELARS